MIRVVVAELPEYAGLDLSVELSERYYE